jgi:hypothetical protein
MTRSFKVSAVAALLALGALGTSAPAQQQPQQQSAIGKAAVRTREGSPTIQLTQQQTPVITVVYGPQASQTQAKVIAMLSTADQPQQDKEVYFNRTDAQNRIVAYEGEATGSQNRRITLVAERGDEYAMIEPLGQTEAVMVFGVRKAEPKVAEQQPTQQPAQAQAGQPGQAQPAAAQQPAAQPTPEQQAAQQKQAAEEAKRKAAEPKPDRYDAIVTVFLTTGR